MLGDFFHLEVLTCGSTPWPVRGPVTVQAMRPQLHLLMFWLTQCFDPRLPLPSSPCLARRLPLVFVFLAVLCKQGEEFQSDFLSFGRELVNSLSTAVFRAVCAPETCWFTLRCSKSLSVCTEMQQWIGCVSSLWMFFLFQKKKLPMFAHMFVHEQVMTAIDWKHFCSAHKSKD